MVLKVKMFGKNTDMELRSILGNRNKGVIIAKEIVEAIDEIVEAFGIIFKEQCLERETGSRVVLWGIVIVGNLKCRT